MNEEKIKMIRKGFDTAYIDSSLAADADYKPMFISNRPEKGVKVLSAIEDELLKCDHFRISVAFIKKAGIAPLTMIFEELARKGIKGEILTTNYLTFTEPDALEQLMSFGNITVRMFDVDAANKGFHSKGYIFHRDEVYRIILGSSNMTQYALTSSVEWNTKIITTPEGEVCDAILSEFEEYWNSPFTHNCGDILEAYKVNYSIVKEQQKIASKGKVTLLQNYKLSPNSMQQQFIINLRKIIESGEKRALLISATGTGKTYASAFAMRELGFKRVLFLAHREQLILQARDSYRNVFGDTRSMGIVGAGKYEYDADYVFAMVETLNKDKHLEQYQPDDFDCIILDEAHHSPNKTYLKVMERFQPSLFLGMTATPDKRDDNMEGRNVYELFNHQIAMEIRLQKAMEDDLLCPFHYFGISDLEVSDSMTKAKKLKAEDFSYLTSDERVNHIVQKAKLYGYSGNRVKGLIFCSRIEEGKVLSTKLNAHGLRTVFLSGSDSQSVREDAFSRLTMEEENANSDKQPVDYIISVDILNEGIDIVEVNQVIMLRPTQSPIVFIQQLGRGLRKANGKEYVIILDFIGNYDNNYMIPIALSGDRTYNKDNVRRHVSEGSRVIQGASTIHFDEVSRKRIYAALDKAKFSDIQLLKDNYTNLKNKLGRIPSLVDFDEYGEMDVCRIFENKNIGSYYKFLEKYEDEYSVRLSDVEAKFVEYVSTKLANGKSIEELVLLREIINNIGQSNQLIDKTAQRLKNDYHKEFTRNKVDSVVNVFTNQFAVGAAKATYKECIFIESYTENDVVQIENSNERILEYSSKLLGEKQEYRATLSFLNMLKNPEFYLILKELVDFGVARYERDYANRYQDTSFSLYKKYTYEDVCRILAWEHNEVPLNIGGYKYDKKTKTFPCFINYHKDENVVHTQNYADRFESPERLIAISKSKRTSKSEDVQTFLHAKERGVDVLLFVRKNKDDKISKEFYFLGRMTATGTYNDFVMPNTTENAVEIEWQLETPVREDIYEYLEDR